MHWASGHISILPVILLQRDGLGSVRQIPILAPQEYEMETGLVFQDRHARNVVTRSITL